MALQSDAADQSCLQCPGDWGRISSHVATSRRLCSTSVFQRYAPPDPQTHFSSSSDSGWEMIVADSQTGLKNFQDQTADSEKCVHHAALSSRIGLSDHILFPRIHLCVS